MDRRRTLRALCATATLATTLGLVGGIAPATAGAPATFAARVAIPDAPTAPSVRMGMSAPKSEWSTRLAEVGGVDARRIFGDLERPENALKLAAAEVAAGREPILSFKLPDNDWSGAANGRFDAELKSLAAQLDRLPGRVFVTIHHEPTGNGSPAAYAAMQKHVLPLLSPPSNVDAGVIVNGFWWSAGSQGYTDAEIAQWLPASVLRLAEVVAADTYQGGTTSRIGENAGVKIKRMSAWAGRTGVKRLGIGEYNGLDAASIKAAGDAVLADRRFQFACIFNSSVNNRDGVDWVLSGDRLAAFRTAVRESRRTVSTSAARPGTSSLSRSTPVTTTVAAH